MPIVISNPKHVPLSLSADTLSLSVNSIAHASFLSPHKTGPATMRFAIMWEVQI
ncbi:hypothetical protein SOVF_167890 [Spinacia oleracea]|nr:hypothetical protein SOVF_167890 [Spinacia oleracea]